MSRSGIRIVRLMAFTGLTLMPGLALMAPPTARAGFFTLQPGSVGGTTYGVGGYSPIAHTDPEFLTGNVSNGALISPGNGYGSVGTSVGGVQQDFGGVPAPVGNLAAGINTFATSTTIPNALFGAGSYSYQSNDFGISWSNFSLSDSIVDNNFSLSASRGIATYVSNVAIINGQAGVFFGVSGFLPPGTQGFASLAGEFTDTSALGVVKQRSQDAVLIFAENNGSGLPNGEQNFNITPALGGVNNGVAANSTSFYTQTIDSFGNLRFTAYGVALLPGISYAVGDTLTIDGTMTLLVDPGADYEPLLLPSTLPGGNPYPIIGTGISAVPEPASLVMCGTGLAIIGLGYAWRRSKMTTA